MEFQETWKFKRRCPGNNYGDDDEASANLRGPLSLSTKFSPTRRLTLFCFSETSPFPPDCICTSDFRLSLKKESSCHAVELLGVSGARRKLTLKLWRDCEFFEKLWVQFQISKMKLIKITSGKRHTPSCSRRRTRNVTRFWRNIWLKMFSTSSKCGRPHWARLSWTLSSQAWKIWIVALAFMRQMRTATRYL